MSRCAAAYRHEEIKTDAALWREHTNPIGVQEAGPRRGPQLLANCKGCNTTLARPYVKP